MKKITSYDIKLFTKGLKSNLGIDFTEYAGAFMRRRVALFLEKWGIPDLETLLLKLEQFESIRNKFLEFMSVETTELFRDPGFWRTFVKIVIPNLQKKDKFYVLVPYISSDDELFTLLVVFKMYGLLEQAEIIATTPFKINIERTQNAIYTTKKFEQAEENFKRFLQKPEAKLDEFFVQELTIMRFDPKLISRVRFIVADLLTNSFNPDNVSFDLILFRNRMIYFNLNLQNKVLETLYYNLAPKGYLIIGYKENLTSFVFSDKLKQMDKVEKIFMKTK